MATAVVELIGDDDRGTPVQRMEGIGDLHLLAQKPGIMRLRRTAERTVPPPCTP